MIAIDTNIIIRFLTRDDEAQFQQSSGLFRNEEIFIPDTVILETEWVLQFAYDFSAAEICQTFRKLLGMKNVRVSDERKVAQAIAWHEQGLDFADALHLVLSESYSRFVTFDEKLIKRAKKFSVYRIEKP